MTWLYCLSTLVVLSTSFVTGIRYEPNWASIDSRPIPAWYDEGKLGIFIHFGVFSVPSVGFNSESEWFWNYWKNLKVPAYIDFMNKNYKPDFTYADFAKDFTAEFFDANKWADILNSSGADYIVFTSKHGEGYTNWPSNISFNWNSMAVGPKRDIVGELMEAIRGKTKLHFGLYHCLYEWLHPLYLRDKENNWQTRDFVTKKALPGLYEIVNTYKPDIVWSDGDYEAPDTYWNSTGFLAWLYNDSPVKDIVVTNDRWGIGANCTHGGVWTCRDRYLPGKLQTHKWVNAMTIDRQSWGYRRNADLSQYLSIEEILATFAQTVSCGGNMLMNVGPQKDGIIAPIFEERLRQLGQWLSVNGDAIRGTRPWTTQNDTLTPTVWYTKKANIIYAIVLNWPETDTLELAAPVPSANTRVALLGYTGGQFQYTNLPTGGIGIMIPPIAVNKMPCQWAWVFTLTNLKNA
ncbi:alpha-L-fucosidase isoform X1 [Patella vulgata]|uniref:alpha-L-fucosidase isoform X1 n=2 Tax=Patella vulgata TaxID=6465 RepID=UPI0021805ECF|nr:alpha-L-fucosidase isoform X1 [Patella vulgata]